MKETRPTRVCVIGLGYVGLPTASMLATRGMSVVGVDADPKIVDTINGGDAHISEPDLDVLVRSAVNSGQMVTSLEPEEADVFLIAVPTPFTDGRKPDLTHVRQAVEAMAPHLAPGNLVVLESTSPVGTTEAVAVWLQEFRPDLVIPARGGGECPKEEESRRIYIAYCPERILPGRILRELVENDRVVGGIDPVSAEKARDFYSLFVAGDVLVTDSRTAELCKLAENAFRDVNIAFANELSLVCERLDIDVWAVMELANRHPRVNILRPGPGVGGHCIAVDPWFIVSSAPDITPLMCAAREVNDGKPRHVVETIRRLVSGVKSPVIACLGLSYKADVGDLRESPAVEIAKRLAEERVGRVFVVDPHVSEVPRALAEVGIELTETDAAIEKADIVVLLTDHHEFRKLDRGLLVGKAVVDTRGFWR